MDVFKAAVYAIKDMTESRKVDKPDKPNKPISDFKMDVVKAQLYAIKDMTESRKPEKPIDTKKEVPEKSKERRRRTRTGEITYESDTPRKHRHRSDSLTRSHDEEKVRRRRSTKDGSKGPDRHLSRRKTESDGVDPTRKQIWLPEEGKPPRRDSDTRRRRVSRDRTQIERGRRPREEHEKRYGDAELSESERRGKELRTIREREDIKEREKRQERSRASTRVGEYISRVRSRDRSTTHGPKLRRSRTTAGNGRDVSRTTDIQTQSGVEGVTAQLTAANLATKNEGYVDRHVPTLLNRGLGDMTRTYIEGYGDQDEIDEWVEKDIERKRMASGGT